MSLRPSEFVKRQVRVTPYPHEDAGWIIANAGDEVCLFSRRTIRMSRRAQSDQTVRGLDGNGRITEQQKQRFYCDNFFVDLMGAGLT